MVLGVFAHCLDSQQVWSAQCFELNSFRARVWPTIHWQGGLPWRICSSTPSAGRDEARTSMGSRSWDSCTSLSAVDYHPYSTGNFCNNGGKVPFLVEGLFEPGECVSRCTRAHNCAFVTLYRNGWCQLGSKCLQESPAGDSSAMTYAKVVKSVCKDEECWGGWD
ncbi:unnamed protein product [Durusdinium trenchii]|uniref:Apple domain-containing protein n=1 Tax=Durusdinium trenchii TaxID=1381693 RepID=A0ABP0M152_9DINO